MSGSRSWRPPSSRWVSSRCRSWLEAAAEALGARRSGHAVRRAEPVLRVARRRHRGRHRARPTCPCGWRACSPRAPGRGGPRSGSWSAGEPELAAAWPQEAGSSEHGSDADGPGLRSLDVTLSGTRGDTRLGILRLQEHRDAAAVAGRGAPVRRPRGPGRPGASRRSAARRAGAAGRRPGGAGRATSRRRVDASSTPTTPNGGAWNATSTTGRSSTWSRSWSTSAWPRPSPPDHPTAHEPCSPSRATPSTTRSRAWSTSPAGSTRRSSPRTASRRRCVTSCAPAHPGRGARPRDRQARRRGRDGAVLLLCRGGAERRQARRRQPDRGRARHRRRTARGCSFATTGTASTRRPSWRPAGSATCATASTR